MAKKLGIAYYDKDIIGQIAEQSGLSPEYIKENAELSPKKGLFAYAFAGRDITGKSIEDIVYEAQRKVILELAGKEPCVIVGRNADYILKDRDDVLNVFIHGDMPEKTQRIMGLYNVEEKEAVMTLALNATTVAVVWFGGNMIIGGKMQVGDLTAFTNYIVQIMGSLTMLSIVFLNWARAVASFRRVREVLEEEIDLTDDNALYKERKVEDGNISFKNVSFRYYKNSEENVLSNIGFDVKAGQTLGIIGPTGSGKTTLVSLISRLYDVDAGEVCVDGVNVKEYSLDNLRNGIGMVLQKNTLFSGNIYENLRWGNENADEKTIAQAAADAQADKFIRGFREGYNTQLGQGGSNVSGGQKQRLCIARALLKHPKILILDDSTSAVDTATEKYIRNVLYGKYSDMTKIIIAQRITSVMEADEILVMDNGCVKGFGTHEELLKTCPLYKEIFDIQISKEVG